MLTASPTVERPGNSALSTTLHAPARAAGDWLSVLSHLDPRYGGLSAAVPALAGAVTGSGGVHSVTVAGFCLPGEHFAPTVAGNVAVRYFPLGAAAWWRNAAARNEFRRAAEAAAGIHVHGIWQHSTGAAVAAAHTARKPYVVSAHGMLERWALNQKRLKKAIYATLFERRRLAGAACLHALTEAEADDYRRFGLGNPVAVIPNGVTVPANLSAGPFLDSFPELAGKRLVLFLGRLHVKKGLDLLAEAWGRLASAWPDTQLVIAGPDCDGTEARMRAALEARGVAHRATFTGMLAGDLKWSALAAADCYILPSYSEGLSVSVLEALGAGLPVLITEGCNLPEVARHECGYVVKPTALAVENALAELLGASGAARSSFRNNAVRLVEERFSWPAVGARMSELYRLLESGGRP